MPRTYRPSHLLPPAHSSPPKWLMAVLMLCLGLVLAALLLRTDLGASTPAQAAEATPSLSPTAAPSPTPAPTPTPEPTPAPTPEPDWSLPVPEGEAVDQEEWFADAVFIGDSRIDGFKLYSGVTSEATFLDYTGLTVFDVAEGKKVIRQGSEKITILDALSQKTYGKIYIALGVNELGYYDPEGFAAVYGQVIDAIRESQPDARLYIHSIIPVNTKKCKANDIPYYVTNENIIAYNQVLPDLCQEKKLRLIGIPEALLDEAGEMSPEVSADGVHFKKPGYGLWLDYLTTHTGE